MIKKIEIKNIKGIGEDKNSVYEFDFLPNIPTIIVAPNGYGKSSFAIAFDSLKTNKIDLSSRTHAYEMDDENKEYSITLELDDKTLEADHEQNTISNDFNCFVIKSLLKAGKNQISAKVRTEKLALNDVKFKNTIPKRPDKTSIDYNLNDKKNSFGKNGYLLRSIEKLYIARDSSFFFELSFVYKEVSNTNKTIQKDIDNFKKQINEYEGSNKKIHSKIEKELNENFNNISPLKEIYNVIDKIRYCEEFSKSQKYLASWQIYEDIFYQKITKEFLERKRYEYRKKKIEEKLAHYTSNIWLDIKLVEERRKLILKFPDVRLISNGQRDIMCLIAQMVSIEWELEKERNKEKNILLIIDEVFDYFDDANLIVAQYYVTKFIERCKRDNRKAYPIFLTHLDPEVFNSLTFQKKKIYFVSSNEIYQSEFYTSFVKRRSNDNDKSFNNILSTYYFHFHNTNELSPQEKKCLDPHLKANKLFDLKKFNQFLRGEFEKYLIKDDRRYCGFSVCCYIRREIERYFYFKLKDELKDDFLKRNGTTNKLNFAAENGVEVPEVFFMLGFIHNQVLHYKNNPHKKSIDNPVLKLNNEGVKSIIKTIYQKYFKSNIL